MLQQNPGPSTRATNSPSRRPLLALSMQDCKKPNQVLIYLGLPCHVFMKRAYPSLTNSTLLRKRIHLSSPLQHIRLNTLFS